MLMCGDKYSNYPYYNLKHIVGGYKKVKNNILYDQKNNPNVYDEFKDTYNSSEKYKDQRERLIESIEKTGNNEDIISILIEFIKNSKEKVADEFETDYNSSKDPKERLRELLKKLSDDQHIMSILIEFIGVEKIIEGVEIFKKKNCRSENHPLKETPDGN